MAKFCTKCGKEIRIKDKFCPNCGENTSEEKDTDEKVNSKSKILAGILGIFVGAIGVHNFYLGYTGKAVAQVLITVLSLGLLSFISGIWGLIEGILILTGNIHLDANGNELTD